MLRIEGYVRACPDCGGTGDSCALCDGTGQVLISPHREAAWITVAQTATGGSYSMPLPEDIKKEMVERIDTRPWWRKLGVR